MNYRFDFDACVELAIEGVTLSEQLEVEVRAIYDSAADDPFIDEITIGEHAATITLNKRVTAPLHRALWDALVPVVQASCEMDDAFQQLLDDEDLRVDPHADYRLGAAEYGVGSYA